MIGLVTMVMVAVVGLVITLSTVDLARFQARADQLVGVTPSSAATLLCVAPGSDSRATDCSLYSGENHRLVCFVISSFAKHSGRDGVDVLSGPVADAPRVICFGQKAAEPMLHFNWRQGYFDSFELLQAERPISADPYR